QPSGPTIQETIETALAGITGERVKLLGSGRTDSGVHALGQVASFRTESRLGPVEIQKGLNSVLPKDIVITKAEEAEPDFHAQLSARSKTYVYKILNRPYPSAILRDRAWFVPYPLKPPLMDEAARHLIGEHDFRAFAQAEAAVKSTVRTVLAASVTKRRDLIEISIEADGFMKRMVRLIAGTLAQVGRERITPAQFREILESGEKTKHVHAAPAHGLYLKEVNY
ncbi:MAG TPA: tRNA pseudouridine(38-40) synthase TruA, partial [Thermodesulfobacteriota bacterium]|nr:tRNA pseudouridine(38-40) synthase TruA [Thermodesulfobacteriota bacterium]